MEARKTASKSCLRRALTLLALLPAVTACGPEQQLPEPLGVAKHEARATSETMTPALRAAYIANVQATASRDYALKTKGDVLKAHNAAQRFDVEMGETVNVRLPRDERLSFDLAGVGCDGELRAVSKAKPAAAGNRVEYVRRGGEVGDLTEWYVHGPLGLEQGFTLDRPLDCGAREVVIDVGMGGSLVPSVAAREKAVLLRNAAGRAVARYSDLYVVDAAGRELPSKLEVVGGSVRIRFDEREAMYPVWVDPLVAVEQAKLFPSDGQTGDLWGWFVGISKETVIVGGGASFPDVFVGSQNSWIPQGTLAPDDGAIAGPVAVVGDTAIAGAAGSHAAYVFTRASGMWTERAKLESSDGVMQDFFGGRLAISGGTVVIGAEYDDDKGTDAGAAYIFEGSGDVWIQQAKLLASDGEGKDPATGDFIADSFGSAVAVAGDRAVIGAFRHPTAGTYGGVAYVFERVGTDWIEQFQLVSDDLEYGALFGTSVAISGDTILVGAPGANAAYVFASDGENWIQEAKLVPAGGAGEEFGFAVALEGDIAVVGDRDGGRTHLFSRSNGQWTEETVLAPSNTKLFGAAVGLSGGNLVVGAPWDSEAGTSFGAAYIYTIGSPNGTPCSTPSECASTFCIDGFCCDTRCDAGLCDACAVSAGASADGVCTPLSGDACDDENPCTLSDVCDSGVCVGVPASCAASDPCQEDGACNPTSGLCENEAKTDGALCPLGVCQDGACQPAEEPNGSPRVVGGDCGCTLWRRPRGASWAVLTLAIVAAFVERRRLRVRATLSG